ncbi:replication stress response regulator SDE2 isoform X2 [Oryzias latipes]|uniref:replication stress response regulator SDE2 isoform X2 n=1 Tax=Oryzias latipes TaxID=8090 RepID=UPI0000EA217B|nr:replication stress response regulator SDE2 isoform X2 [Oryzias latipes]
MRVPLEGRMEVFVVVPRSRGSACVLPRGSVVKDVLDRFVSQQNFYVTTNGRLAPPQDPLQDGWTYRLEPRLCGGKGGFGSMLRALGAQIEKTTNREACRDLSGRRLRDVNHEKEMAEWLKKQAEREAEKEQRRLERLQRKLAAPKHQLCDPEYQRQCHHLSERLEDSVLKGLQASSGAPAAAADITAVKRASSTVPGGAPPQKKKAGGGAAASFWTGLEELQSSEEEEEEEEEPLCLQTAGSRHVTMATESPPCRSSSADPVPGPSEDSGPSEPAAEDAGPPSEPAVKNTGPSAEPDVASSKEQRPPDPQEFCNQSQQVDLSLVTSVQQLELLGPDVLKAELQRRGLKCGGTLQERAARLFSVRDFSPGQINPALLAKPTKAKKK